MTGTLGFKIALKGQWIAVLLFVVFLAGCGSGTPDSDKAIRLEVWAHAGQESERNTLRAQIERFQKAQPGVRIHLTLIPEGSYNAQVQAAAVAGELPDLLEFDGPFLYTYVWQGRLIPLDGRLSDSVRTDLLPSILNQGTYRDRLYSVGTFDSGLGLYADRSRLAAAGVRIPTSPAEAWSVGEFNRILTDLAQQDPDGAVLDLKLNYAGEWYTYAFSPLIQSAGGDLIDRSTYQSANGVLNGPEAVRAMRIIQSWIHAGFVDPNIDGASFISGRVALAMGGHWNYRQYAAALGDNLLVLPLPDFGTGAKTGQGSWNWAVTVKCTQPAAAIAFLEFLLTPQEVLAMTEANGAVPGTQAAIAQSALYREDGPLSLFVTQLVGGYAVPRPRTPAYPVITATFQKAFDRIRSGGDVQEVLDRAVRTIDEEIEDNQGYPWVGGE
jgi:multiple sugar transport system substrate-binding protein